MGAYRILPAGRCRLGAQICAAVLLTACTAADPGNPAPAPSGSIGAAVPVESVGQEVPTDLQAERHFGMDRATWQHMRDVATSLPWVTVSAAGVQQAAACTGEGAPTVVYMNGFGEPAAGSWPLASDAQSRSNRVCLYDRPGLGLSPPRAGAAPHSTPEQHANEMLAMLGVLDEPGPYVLVGWSYGGLVARSAAAQHPEDVAGMVLVDATSPLAEGLEEPLNGEQGIIDTDTITNSIGLGPDLGARPVVVLEAGQPFTDAPEGFQKTWSDLQRQAATISENSVHGIIDESDHAIPMRNPAAVVAATSAVVESIRAGNTPLPACPDELAAAGVTCAGT